MIREIHFLLIIFVRSFVPLYHSPLCCRANILVSSRFNVAGANMSDDDRRGEDRYGRDLKEGKEEVGESPPRRRNGRGRSDSGSSGSSSSESDSYDRRRRKKRGRESSSSDEAPSRRRGRARHSPSSSASDSSSSDDSRRGSRRRHKDEKRAQREQMRKEREEVLARERAKVEALVASNAALGGRAGGVYIPPHRLALLQQGNQDKNERDDQQSPELQKQTWEALRKSINGLVNKVSPHNLKEIAIELLQENIWRGRGLLCRALMKAQNTSPKFSNVYAALFAVINSKFPDIGVLLIRRLIDQFKKAYRRRDKMNLISATKFIAHLVNQLVCGVVLPLQILLLLLEKPTDDSVEVAVSLMQEMGQRLSELSPQAFNGLFDQFRTILHEGSVDKRIIYLIEGLLAVRRRNFSEFPAMLESLDIVYEEDQITHENISLDDEDEDGKPLPIDEHLDFYRLDNEYALHEREYQDILDDILGGDDDDDSEDSQLSGDENADKTVAIEDQTNTEDTVIKRGIYLTIMSSRDHEEVVHKLRKMNVRLNHLGTPSLKHFSVEHMLTFDLIFDVQTFCSDTSNSNVSMNAGSSNQSHLSNDRPMLLSRTYLPQVLRSHC